ncbi:kinase-like domain-containing protein [Phycomyces nitens]|nr:kinase-like domain-containing protein [Phycomyces nitens]
MSILFQLKNLFWPAKSTISCSLDRQDSLGSVCPTRESSEFVPPVYNGLEQYRLVSKLGDGAFSNVFKAINLQTNETFAIKAVRKFELSQAQKASVLKEAQIMRSMDHPSIVKLYDFVETKEHYFLILENCQGGELFHRIVRLTYFSEDLTRHCIQQVAEAIRYLHQEKGIVHRDIKPENLLFEPIPFLDRPVDIGLQVEYDEPKEDEGRFVPGLGGGGIGRVKLADFGLSKVVWDQQTMTPCGTVGYTAPEIVRDERYSKSVDMWALGCVLYTMLCGFPPFYDEDTKILTEKVARGQYTFLSPWWDSISADAKDLVSHLLCMDPTKRYTIDQFMQHTWMTSDCATPVASFSTHDHIPPSLSASGTATDETFDDTVDETVDETVDDDMNKSESSLAAPKTPRRTVNGNKLGDLKEIVDLSYAIQRLTDERAQIKLRRKQQSKHNRLQDFNLLTDKDDFEDGWIIPTTEDAEIVPQKSKGLFPRTNQTDQPIYSLCLLQQQQQQKPKRSPETPFTPILNPDHVFGLCMDKTTLLGRRRQGYMSAQVTLARAFAEDTA